MAEAGLQEIAEIRRINAPDDDHTARLATSSTASAAPAVTTSKKPAVVASAAPANSEDRTICVTAPTVSADVRNVTHAMEGSKFVQSNEERERAETWKVDDGGEGGRGEGGGGEEGRGGGGSDLEGEEWAIVLALFSSNLCFAIEGPGRVSDFRTAGGKHIKEAEREQGEEAKTTLEDEHVTSARYRSAVFCSASIVLKKTCLFLSPLSRRRVSTTALGGTFGPKQNLIDEAA